MAEGLTAEQQQRMTDFIVTARMSMSEAVLETIGACERTIAAWSSSAPEGGTNE